MVNLIFDFFPISLDRFFHGRKLILVHASYNALKIGFQFLCIYAVHFIELMKHRVFTGSDTILRRKTIEIFFEIPLFRAFHLEDFWQATLCLPHIDLTNLIVCR